MERVAVEPLPDIKDFLPRWRSVIVNRSKRDRAGDWHTTEDRWLREVVQYLEGSDGLAKLARSTRRTDDLRAWCRSLGNAGNWEAARAAFEEAAGLVRNNSYVRGEFLDGAALAAQSLGRKDPPAHLERAWHASPSMPRLRRWLGTSDDPETLERTIGEALEQCPKQAVRQRALLHVLNRDFSSAAELLASAAGLGWSDGEHPGHLLVPLFARFMGGKAVSFRSDAELEPTTADNDPRLLTTPVLALLERAGVDCIVDAAPRMTVLAAMRKAAENRVAGVTDQKRRRHYGHAAELVATCVACDETGEAARWAAELKINYRRFPALRDAIEQAIGG